MNKRLAGIITALLLGAINTTAPHAAVVAGGTAVVDWNSFSITGPITLSSTARWTYVEAQVTNESGADFSYNSVQNWTDPVSSSATADNDLSNADATASALSAADDLSAPTATTIYPLRVAGSVTQAYRIGDFTVNSAGDILMSVGYSLSASGMTEFPGELAWLNVIAIMELYISGLGPAPVASDYDSITVKLEDGADGNFSKSGTLSLRYAAAAGTSGFLAVNAVANNVAQSIFVPEPSSVALLALGLVALSAARLPRRAPPLSS